jgi:hypothetical protein
MPSSERIWESRRHWFRFWTYPTQQYRPRRAYFRPTDASDLNIALVPLIDSIVTVRFVEIAGADGRFAGQRLHHTLGQGISARRFVPTGARFPISWTDGAARAKASGTQPVVGHEECRHGCECFPTRPSIAASLVPVRNFTARQKVRGADDQHDLTRRDGHGAARVSVSLPNPHVQCEIGRQTMFLHPIPKSVRHTRRLFGASVAGTVVQVAQRRTGQMQSARKWCLPLRTNEHEERHVLSRAAFNVGLVHLGR